MLNFLRDGFLFDRNWYANMTPTAADNLILNAISQHKKYKCIQKTIRKKSWRKTHQELFHEKMDVHRVSLYHKLLGTKRIY